jgi:ankyrin repeat protein
MSGFEFDIQLLFLTTLPGACTAAILFNALQPYPHGHYLCRAAHCNNQKEMYSLLFDEQLDPNSTNHTCTPLHIAAYKNYHEIAKLLIKKNANTNIHNGRKRTPLHMAVSGQHNDMIDFLCFVGADTNIQDYKGKTPLHRAHNLACATSLLYYGASPYIRDNTGQTAAEISQRKNNTEVANYIRYILQNNENARHHTDNAQIIERFLQSNAIQRQALLDDFRIYIYIVSHCEQYHYAIEIYKIPGIWLLYAVWFRDETIVDMLLKKAHIRDHINTCKDIHGNRILHVAAQYAHHADLITKLLTQGANPKQKNNAGNTPYDIAKKHTYKAIGRVLRDWHEIDTLCTHAREQYISTRIPESEKPNIGILPPEIMDTVIKFSVPA